VRRTEAGCEGGTARAWRRLAGRPATQDVAAARGVLLLQPVPHVRESVREGPGQAVGDPHGVADHAATVGDELGEGAPRGALRLERLQRVALGAPPCERACGSCGVVCGPAGRAGVARPRQGQGIARAEAQHVIRAPGGDHGALGACETHGHGWAMAPRAPRGAPRVDGLGWVRELEACTGCGASRLEAHIRGGSSPVETNKSRPGFVGSLWHASSPSGCERGEKGQAS